MKDETAKNGYESYDRLRNLLYSLPIGIFLVSKKDSKILDVNPATVYLIDMPVEYILGKDINSFLQMKQNNDDSEFFTNICSECVLESKGGKTYHLMVNEVEFSSDTNDYTLYTLVDITDRIIAENKLQESRELYKTLFSSSADGFFILSDKIIKCNDKFCKQLQYGIEEIIFRSLLDLSPDYQPKSIPSETIMNEKIKNALSGVSQYFYWQFLRKDGAILETEISLKAVKLEKGPVLMGNVRDISERLLLEKHKIEKERLEGILQLAGAVGHELNQPLQIISGYLELLCNSSYKEEIEVLDPVEYVKIPVNKFEIIVQSTKRMIDTIRKLMNLTSYKTKEYIQDTQIIDLDGSSDSENS